VTTPNKISTPRRGQKKVYIRYLPDPLLTKNKKIIIKKIMGLPIDPLRYSKGAHKDLL
jgi:hypothetical protein